MWFKHGRRLCEARECSAPPEIGHARPAYAWAPPEISQQDVLFMVLFLCWHCLSTKIIASLTYFLLSQLVYLTITPVLPRPVVWTPYEYEENLEILLIRSASVIFCLLRTKAMIWMTVSFYCSLHARCNDPRCAIITAQDKKRWMLVCLR